MHPTALKNCQEFKVAYHDTLIEINPDYKIVEIGSQDVNGSLRGIFPPGLEYIGVDFVPGNGVDVILGDPYKLPFDDNSVDVVLCSSCFEHSEMFWLLHLEIIRILKPHGLFYLNVPSNGDVHKWPVDCWRFYPDSAKALVTWANYNNYNIELLESYTSAQNKGIWNDFVAVYCKDANQSCRYLSRILDNKQDYWNGVTNLRSDISKPTTMSEDQKKVEVMRKIAIGEIPVS